MRKFLLVLTFVSLLFSANAQHRTVTTAGGLQLIEREIARPDQTGFAFHDMLQHGYWNPERQLDYDSLNVGFLGNWPMGVSYSLAYAGFGNIFLVGSGGAVIIVDASDPENPQEISIVHSRSLVDAIFYDQETSRLYLGAYFSGVEIWDLNDLENPARLARIPTVSYPRGGVYAEGDLVYVMTVANGIHIFDISDMSNIAEVGHFPIPSSSLIWNSAKDGDMMFCPSFQNCRIVNIHDPANPSLAGVVAGVSTGVAAADGILYQVSYNFGLKIWDVSNPASVQQLGQIPLIGYPYRVMVKGNYAFVANSTSNPGGGVNIIDISDPANPVEVSAYAGYANFVAAGDDVLFFSGGNPNYNILDITDIASPELLTTVPIPNWTADVCVDGNLAFAGSNGFRVFDVTDKSKPEQIGYHETQGDLVAVSGDIAVFIPKSMGSNNPVNIMDISDPANPVKRGHYTAPVMTYDIVLKDHYAFIACWWNGFRVVDFSDPDSPVLAAHKFTWYQGAEPGVEWCFVQALDIAGDYLFLIDYQPFEDDDTKGLYVFDISDPHDPVFLHRFADINAKGNDVAVQGNYAFIADDLGGMEVIDISDIYNPFIAGYVYTPDVANAIAIDGDYAYLANYIMGGLQVVDISFPSNPVNAGHYKPSGVFALGVTIDGSHAFVADGIGGFQIYDNLIITGIADKDPSEQLPVNVFPNPSAGTTNIAFHSPQTAFCEISVFDVRGTLMATIHEGVIQPGDHQFRWDGNVTGGVYLISVRLDDVTKVSRLVMIR